jgi:hypothetical protein
MADKQFPQVDINKASEQDLIAIKGIGPSLAKQIIKGRPYQAIKDLTAVQGISNAKLDLITPYLSLGKKKEPAKAKSNPDTKMKTETKPAAKIGQTEAFVFLENRNERQDALLIIFGGFILGLLILFLRRSKE